MKAFVLDNSVLCAWFIASQATPYADAIAQRLETERAMAPALLQLEYINVLRTACKRGRLLAQQAREVVERVGILPIEFDAQAPSATAILSLALRFDLTTYDATYLELALREQLPIATQDAALAEAAWAAGVGVVK
ncbi:type II toxin-antitoxin system VapC family toxin [Azoarcus sp. PA01]|nr:type II toxin-antitoxin system VapC family toxin [Azoarcus sp. PA01]